MRHHRLFLLALVALAGCGGGGQWAGPPQPNPQGVIPTNGFDTHAASPEALAAAFLRLDAQRGSTTSLTTSQAPEGGDRATLVVILDGLLDDSVAAVRYELVVTRNSDGWRLSSARRTQRCRSGRGHAAFSAEPCI